MAAWSSLVSSSGKRSASVIALSSSTFLAPYGTPSPTSDVRQLDRLPARVAAPGRSSAAATTTGACRARAVATATVMVEAAAASLRASGHRGQLMLSALLPSAFSTTVLPGSMNALAVVAVAVT